MLNKRSLELFKTQLKDSPIYHLSLSSKELFHSNFLGWLSETYPDEMSSVWLSCVGESNDWGLIQFVYRERKNKDLTIEYSSGKKLVVEIKVKSAPDGRQLENYLKDDDIDRLVLLSFFDLDGKAGVEPKSFVLPSGTNCQWLPWGALLHNIKNKLSTIDNVYHREMINDYYGYVLQLSSLAPHIAVDFESDQSFFLDDDLDTSLRDLRLHDLVYKMRYSTLSMELAKFQNVTCGDWREVEQSKFASNAAMTNSTGVTSIGYILSEGVSEPEKLIVAGIQLQHKSYRMFFLWPNKKFSKKCAEKIFSNDLWFNVENDNFLEKYAAPCSMRNVFGQYDGVFYYRYRKITADITPKTLASAMYDHAKHIKENEAKFRQIISEVLS